MHMWSMILLGVAVVMGFVSMVLSAMVASDISKGEDADKIKKMANGAAIINGVTVLILFVLLGMCFYAWNQERGGKYF